jgi:oxygen-independent coproporphyrinogen-3 oxidase
MSNREDKLRRHVIMALICDLQLDIRECEREFGIDFHKHFAEALQNLATAEADGLLEVEPRYLRVTPEGRPFLRNLCMPFDAYLDEHTRSGRAKFSATV